MGAEGPRLAGQEPPGFSGEYAGDIGQQRLWKTERVHDTASRSSDRVRASAWCTCSCCLESVGHLGNILMRQNKDDRACGLEDLSLVLVVAIQQ